MTLSKKALLLLSSITLLFAACQKDLSVKEELNSAKEESESLTVSSNALTPLPCHSISFSIDKPDEPGQVPSFRFTKTLYSDSRVKTINMLSRVYPIYSGYKKHAVELTGTFSYSTERAYLKGTSEVWEYYKTATGAGARRSISKKNVNWKFYFNPAGYCWKLTDLDRSIYSQGEDSEWESFYVYYSGPGQTIPDSYLIGDDPITQEGTQNRAMFTKRDKFENILSFYFPWGGGGSSTTYDYDYNIPRGSKKYSFIPSQNLICQEFSLLEVMQWVPQPTHQRKAVAGMFQLPNGTTIKQSQIYKNYQFDAKGNQTSVTYGDNVLQKTSWYCK